MGFNLILYLIGASRCSLSKGLGLSKPCSAHFPGDAGATKLAVNGTFTHSYCHQNWLSYINTYDFIISGCYLSKCECEWHQLTSIHKLRSRMTDLICCETGVVSQIHASTPRCFMSIFLLKSNSDTRQNIHFNVLNKLCASFIVKTTFGK